MRDIIEKVRSQLNWQVEEKVGSSGYFQIYTYPAERRHVITWPAPNVADPPRLVELLHELIHAQLAEEVHPLFSGSFFVPGTSEALMRAVAPAVRAASDWFVDDRVMRLVPAQEEAQIREHLKLTKGKVSGDIFLGVSRGFIQAQAVKYGLFPAKKFKKKGQAISNRVMDAFLAVEPSQPTIKSLQKLVNLVLRAYSTLQVELVRAQDMDVWKIREGLTKRR